ncbi:MAG: nucleotidyltransferase family protein [Alphaproteobacteria bacterium]
MQAIILAGGFGTRLRSAIGDVPKPMAPVAGRPFLRWLLEYMAQQGIRQATLCLHHMPHMIQRTLGSHYAGIRLSYIIEQSPLGTGGAIKNALAQMNTSKPVFVLNGDSLVQLNYMQMLQNHYRMQRPLTIATQTMPDCSRYSLLELEQGHVHSYKTRGTKAPGIISNGFYIVEPDVFDGAELPAAFSFEADFLAPYVPTIRPANYNGAGYFIDIGVPDDYARAQAEIPALLGNRQAA